MLLFQNKGFEERDISGIDQIKSVDCRSVSRSEEKEHQTYPARANTRSAALTYSGSVKIINGRKDEGGRVVGINRGKDTA